MKIDRCELLEFLFNAKRKRLGVRICRIPVYQPLITGVVFADSAVEQGGGTNLIQTEPPLCKTVGLVARDVYSSVMLVNVCRGALLRH